MTTMTRSSARELVSEIRQAVQAVADAHGMGLSYPRGRFGPTTLKVTLELSLPDQGGAVQTTERANYKLLAEHYGMKQEWLDQTFQSQGRTFAVSGLNVRARKLPVLCKDTHTDKMYKFRTASVVNGFARKV